MEACILGGMDVRSRMGVCTLFMGVMLDDACVLYVIVRFCITYCSASGLVDGRDCTLCLCVR